MRACKTALASALMLAAPEPATAQQSSVSIAQAAAPDRKLDAEIEALLPAPSPQARAAAERLFHARFPKGLAPFNPAELNLSDSKMLEDCRKIQPIEGFPTPECDDGYVQRQRARLLRIASTIRAAQKTIVIASYARHLGVDEILKSAEFFESSAGRKLANAQPAVEEDVNRVSKGLLVALVLGNGG